MQENEIVRIFAYLMENFYDYSQCPDWYTQSVKECCSTCQEDSASNDLIRKMRVEKHEKNIQKNCSARFYSIINFLHNDIYDYEISDAWRLEKEKNNIPDNKKGITMKSRENITIFFKEFDLYIDGLLVYILQENNENLELQRMDESIQNVDLCMKKFERMIRGAKKFSIDPFDEVFLYLVAMLVKSYSVPNEFLNLFREHIIMMANNAGDRDKQMEIWKTLTSTVQYEYGIEI